VSWLSFVISLVVFTVLAPVLGCLIAGVDRKISARLQARVGPPLLQPYYDVRKLMAKDDVSVNRFQSFYVAMALLLAILSGVFFFAGGNLLMVVFIISLSSLFFIVAAYSSRSPYAEIGAEREIIQVMSYEPMVILLAVCFYLASGYLVGTGYASFDIATLFSFQKPLVAAMPLAFASLVFILTIKLRKSPFDLSYSHHAHQELVKGITTEMSGKTLAMVEVMHWYETVLFMSWVGMFFVWANWLSILLVILVVAIVYFLEIFIDNNFARMKWQAMVKLSWVVTILGVAINIVVFKLLV